MDGWREVCSDFGHWAASGGIRIPMPEYGWKLKGGGKSRGRVDTWLWDGWIDARVHTRPRPGQARPG